MDPRSPASYRGSLYDELRCMDPITISDDETTPHVVEEPALQEDPLTPTQPDSVLAFSSEEEELDGQASLPPALVLQDAWLPDSSATAEDFRSAEHLAPESMSAAGDAVVASASAERAASVGSGEPAALAAMEPGGFIRERSPYRRPTKWGRCGVVACRPALRPCYPRGGGYPFLGCSRYRVGDTNSCTFTAAVPADRELELPSRVVRRVPVPY